MSRTVADPKSGASLIAGLIKTKEAQIAKIQAELDSLKAMAAAVSSLPANNNKK